MILKLLKVVYCNDLVSYHQTISCQLKFGLSVVSEKLLLLDCIDHPVVYSYNREDTGTSTNKELPISKSTALGYIIKVVFTLQQWPFARPQLTKRNDSDFSDKSDIFPSQNDFGCKQ